MACFHPRYGYRAERGLIRLMPAGTPYWRAPIVVACNQCVGCTAERKRQWGVRTIHELPFCNNKASFLTLTYDKEHLPENGNLPKIRGPNKQKPEHWQNFAKKLRYHFGPFRFLMCGEYGEERNRCHYHCIVLGHDFSEDRAFYKTSDSGDKLYTSKKLRKAWDQGFHSIGSVSIDSASYVAGYIQKRVIGKNARNHYDNRLNEITGEIYTQNPEFGLMSRNKGLGHKWIEKYHTDVYPYDEIIINGQPTKPPVYYDRWYEKNFPDKWEEIKEKRKLKSLANIEDNSPARLQTKKKCFTAKHAAHKFK